MQFKQECKAKRDLNKSVTLSVDFTNWSFMMSNRIQGNRQIPIFGSISSISLQQIEYEKNHAVHSNELGESYTLIPMSIFIDQFWKNRPRIFQDSNKAVRQNAIQTRV